MGRLRGGRKLLRLLASGIALLVGTAGGLRAQNADGTAMAADGVPGGLKQEGADNSGFFHRLIKAYSDDWLGKGPESPEPARRGYPAPLSSPPFPFSDWPYGGSPVIGAADTAGGPLMMAIYGGKDGQWWENSRI